MGLPSGPGWNKSVRPSGSTITVGGRGLAEGRAIYAMTCSTVLRARTRLQVFWHGSPMRVADLSGTTPDGWASWDANPGSRCALVACVVWTLPRSGTVTVTQRPTRSVADPGAARLYPTNDRPIPPKHPRSPPRRHRRGAGSLHRAETTLRAVTGQAPHAVHAPPGGRRRRPRQPVGQPRGAQESAAVAGQDCTGLSYSDCPPEFLDTLAGFLTGRQARPRRRTRWPPRRGSTRPADPS